MRGPARSRRRGAAVVELAVLLPFLTFLLLVAVDYSRVFYFSLTIENAARNAALYGTRDTTHASDTAGIQSVALADCSNVTPTPTVTSQSGTDANGYSVVTVTISYDFHTITNYPGIPSTTTLTRTVSMRVLPN
jgi:Flp pilus assembly protein TadG